MTDSDPGPQQIPSMPVPDELKETVTLTSVDRAVEMLTKSAALELARPWDPSQRRPSGAHRNAQH